MPYEHEAGKLRVLAANARVWYTRHALKEMANDGIVKLDIENMLKRCVVTLVEESKGEET